MKSMFMNYFKDGKLYQWDENKEVFTMSNTSIEGEFCLDKNGMDTLLKFDNPTITLGTQLTVKSGNVKANIKLNNNVLCFPDLNFTDQFKIDVDKIKIASRFVSKNTSRIVLTGINISNGHISATDSFFLYRTECVAPCNLTIASSFIKVITGISGEVEFKSNSSVVACEVEGTTYIGRIYNETYPNLVGLFNTIQEHEKITISKEELKKFLEYSTTKNTYVIFENNKLIINQTASLSEADNDFEIELDLPIKEPICFNGEKILTVVNSIANENIIMKISGSKKPVLFNDEFIICPCNLN